MADIVSRLPTQDQADGATGSAAPTEAILVGGTDGTNLRAISTDSTGKVNIVPLTNSSVVKAQLQDNNGIAVVLGQTTMSASLPVAIASNQSNVPANITQFGGVNISTGTGASGTGIPRVTVSNDSNILATQSGTWTVQQGTPPWSVVGNVASGASDSNDPVKTGAVFNSTLPSITTGQRVDSQADSNGRKIVTNAPLDGSKQTYSASTNDLVAAATPTDIFTITGSATKTIRILRISFSGTQNTSGARDILLIKRSSANTGGTSTTETNIPHDSTNAAGTATVRAYTANPTALGTAVGTVRAKRITLLATNVTNPLDSFIWDFGNRPGQAIVLRGTSEVLAINLNSVTSSSSLLDIDIEWTEE